MRFNVTPTQLQFSTIQYNTIQYHTVQYSTVQYSTIKYNLTVIDCGTAPGNLVYYSNHKFVQKGAKVCINKDSYSNFILY